MTTTENLAAYLSGDAITENLAALCARDGITFTGCVLTADEFAAVCAAAALLPSTPGNNVWD